MSRLLLYRVKKSKQLYILCTECRKPSHENYYAEHRFVVDLVSVGHIKCVDEFIKKCIDSGIEKRHIEALIWRAIEYNCIDTLYLLLRYSYKTYFDGYSVSSKCFEKHITNKLMPNVMYDITRFLVDSKKSMYGIQALLYICIFDVNVSVAIFSRPAPRIKTSKKMYADISADRMNFNYGVPHQYSVLLVPGIFDTSQNIDMKLGLINPE